jgi:hypothetical protein
MFVGEKIAAPFLLVSLESEPALNVLLGLAVWAEKSAPEPTATPTAHSPNARAPSVLFGRLTNCLLLPFTAYLLVAHFRPAVKVKSSEQ